MAGFGNNAGIVPAAGEYEADVGIDEEVKLVDGTLGRHMVVFRTDGKDRRTALSEQIVLIRRSSLHR